MNGLSIHRHPPLRKYEQGWGGGLGGCEEKWGRGRLRRAKKQTARSLMKCLQLKKKKKSSVFASQSFFFETCVVSYVNI